MARQTLAENWRVECIFYDRENSKFCTTSRPLGRYMAATAIEKLAAIATAFDYKFRKIASHGSGGYWVNGEGDTMALLPCISLEVSK